MVLHVKAGARVLKLHNAAFENIQFTAYTPDIGGEISCGAKLSARHVVVTYRVPQMLLLSLTRKFTVDFGPEIEVRELS